MPEWNYSKRDVKGNMWLLAYCQLKETGTNESSSILLFFFLSQNKTMTH